jgi:hypothetical protein
MELKKGEELEWILEDKNHLVLRRCKKKEIRKIAEQSHVPLFYYL